MRFKRPGDAREFEVEVLSREGSQVRVRVDGKEVTAEFETLPDASMLVRAGERRYRVVSEQRRDSILVAAGPANFELVAVEDAIVRSGKGLATPEVLAPTPGKILKVLVSEGDRVEAAQPLVVLEAMKTETTLGAESAAIVKKVRVKPGQMVDHGTVLLELSPIPDDLSVPESEPPEF